MILKNVKSGGVSDIENGNNGDAVPLFSDAPKPTPPHIRRCWKKINQKEEIKNKTLAAGKD